MSYPAVSVLIITYNHERHVRQALESVLSQKTKFEFEIVVGEDCSRDATRSVLNDVQQTCGGRLRLLYRRQNVGMYRNFVDTYNQCRGQYIALLEGDDFWRGEGKLQAQFEYMEAHPECSFSFHPVVWFYEDGIRPGDSWPAHDSVWPAPVPSDVSVESILREMFVPTCSIMIRKSYLPEIPPGMEHLAMLDWPLCVILASRGPAAVLNAEMAAHRNHPGGVWFSVADETRCREALTMFSFLVGVLERRYRPLIHSLMSKWAEELANHYDRRGESSLAFKSLQQSMELDLRARRLSFRKIKWAARLRLPWLYHAVRGTLAPHAKDGPTDHG